MICATRRGIRRSTLAGRAGRKVLTLDDAVRELMKHKAKFRLRGRQIGRRVHATTVQSPGFKVMGFRHPTKKATAGRYAFLTMAGKG